MVERMVVRRVRLRAAGLVPAERRQELRALASRSNQVVVLAAVTGAITGGFVGILDWLVVDVIYDRLRDLNPWLIAPIPALGLFASGAARKYLGGGVSASTADEYLHAFHEPDYRLGWRAFWGRTVAAMATIASGGAFGLEGPALYAGSTFGQALQRRFARWFGGADRRVLLVAGAAAGVAAVFKTPATGAVFALEVPYRDDLARRMLLPALVASATGYLVFASIHGTSPLFAIDSSAGFNVRDLLGSVVVGVVAGIGARVFARLVKIAKRIDATRSSVVTRLIAGVALGVMFACGRLMTGESLVLGAGYDVVAWAVQPGRATGVLIALLVLRCSATATGIAGGGTAGLFVPLVVAGTLTGAIVAAIAGESDPVLFVVIGVAAFLGAGYRVPLAAVMFVAEATGRPAYVVPGLLAAVAAELTMGASSVTPYQRAADRHAVDIS